ncbi:MAG: type II toxin-antitoxin system HipA family toxin [Pseudomonadota bacterium]
MNIPVLVIKLHGRRVGMLFEFAPENAEPIIRFAVDEAYAREAFGAEPVLSESFRAAEPAQQQSFWLNRVAPGFNAVRGLRGDVQLPAFFQNLLPEGTFRRHVAEMAGVDPSDSFAMLAACGKDLPGAVTAEWENIGKAALQDLVTQGRDALEVTVWSEPFQDAISISGVQPKLGVNRDADGRFTGRTRHRDTAIIAKLPSVEYPRMPQMEDLCMRLARLAGVDTCDFELADMKALSAGHRYDLGEEVQGRFLAVTRFDRGPDGRVHFEDFAQVLGVAPENKYSQSYLAIALTLLDLPVCGVPAVHELLRRMEVNDLLGNADMHLKNLGLLYRDGRQAELAPAYDLLSTHVYLGTQGHALALLEEAKAAPKAGAKAEGRANIAKDDHRKPLLTPQSVLRFTNALDIPQKQVARMLREVARQAAATWLEPIQSADITPRQRRLLLDRLGAHLHIRQAIAALKNPALAAAWEAALQQPVEPEVYQPRLMGF